MVSPVVTYGCDSWTVKKAECWRIDAFELWCWRRFLRVPWMARRSNRSILREINPEYSLEGLMLKVPIFWSPDTNSWYIGKVPDAGKDWGQNEKRASEDKMTGWQHWINGHELGQISGNGEEQGGLACSPWGHKESDTTVWLNNNNLCLPVGDAIAQALEFSYPRYLWLWKWKY